MKSLPLFLGVFLLSAPLVNASSISNPQVFRASGATAADIQDEVDAFRDALGPLSRNNFGNLRPDGRREIDWDFFNPNFTDPNLLPDDFFNSGQLFSTTGLEFFTSTGAFAELEATAVQVSSVPTQAIPVEFGLDDQFTPFTEDRIARPVDAPIFSFGIFDPFDPTSPAGVRGFGMVFTDNDQPGFNNQASNAAFQLLDVTGLSLGTFTADRSPDAGLSFVGVLFDAPVIAGGIVQAGSPFFDFDAPDSATNDLIAFDNIIMGEPLTPVSATLAPVPLPMSATLLGGALMSIGLFRRRRLV